MSEHVKESGRDAAETIALRALAFVLSEPRYLDRFLAQTGLTPSELAQNAQSDHVLEAVLNQLMSDDALLLAFAANAALRPEEIARAHDYLATGGGRARPQWSP